MKKLKKNTVLVALIKDRNDWKILHEQHWYRIPTTTNVPIVKNGNIRYIAWYHPKRFPEHLRWKIVKYAKVENISIATRQELFPEEPTSSAKAHKRYYKIEVEQLLELPQPIVSRKGRRIITIPTSEEKFFNSSNINDIFNDSPLEDLLYATLRKYKVPAQRQWHEIINKTRKYWLDFAIFCKDGKINIECDGEQFHNKPDQVHYDKTRNDELTAHGWHVLRYDTRHFKNESEWLKGNLFRTIKKLGGYPSVKDEAVFVVPKINSKGQISLFD